MSEIVLRRPTMEDAEQVMAYRREFLAAHDDLAGTSGLRKCETAEEWLKGIAQRSDPATCPKDHAVSAQYIAVRESDGKLVGMIDLRFHIDHPVLSLWGGHIGYSIRPDERRKGYATEMLRQCLEKAKEHGLYYVMITCDADNVGSEKTILANGGIFQCEVQVDGEPGPIKRYWIKLDA